jgi:hypothetical protein
VGGGDDGYGGEVGGHEAVDVTTSAGGDRRRT